MIIWKAQNLTSPANTLTTAPILISGSVWALVGVSLSGFDIVKFLGPAAANVRKREVGGLSDTDLNLRGIKVATAHNSPSLPQGELGARNCS